MFSNIRGKMIKAAFTLYVLILKCVDWTPFSKSTKTSLGLLPRLFTSSNNCSNSLLYVLSFLFGKSANTQGKILPLRWPCIVYIWKIISGQTLNLPSAYQCTESSKKCNAPCDAKINILSSSPTPLSYIKKGSPFVVVRYACGRSGMSSMWAGVGGMFLSWREWQTFLRNVSYDGRFAATPSEIFWSSVSSIFCVVSSVSSTRLLMSALTLVTWHSVCDGVWVWTCISSKNSSNRESLTLALHWYTFRQ